MTTIVTENCLRCRFTDCVTVCPVNCFHGDDDMLYIDPEVCIDCSACVPECPVHAIHEGEDIPDNLKDWIQINAERAPSLPVIDSKQDPLPTAEARRAELGY
ncbi:MAG: 4Fe-4S binding protein [Gammaproteobacteria bacterium]